MILINVKEQTNRAVRTLFVCMEEIVPRFYLPRELRLPPPERPLLLPERLP
jgi:hypothetical protein